MKITIEVGDNYLAAIKRTGSVTRVLTAAADMLENECRLEYVAGAGAEPPG